MPLNELSASVAESGFRLVLPGRTPTKGNRPTPIRPGLVLPSKQYRRWIKTTETAALTLWARLVRLGARRMGYAPEPAQPAEPKKRSWIAAWFEAVR